MERFQRVMFWMLVPGVLLIAGLATALPLAAPSNSLLLVHLVFAYVLFGSTILNTWTALRHPLSLTERSLPRRLALVHAALYAVTLLWLLCVIIDASAAAIALSLALMGLAIESFLRVRARARVHPLVQKLDSVALTLGLLLCLLACVVAIVVTGVLYLALGTFQTEAYWTFPLMLLGAPWAHTWYLLSSTALFITANFGAITSALLVPMVANVVILIVLIASPSRRLRATNWFFQLGVVRVETQVTPFDGDSYLANDRTPGI